MKDAGISVKEPLERFIIPQEELFNNHEMWYALGSIRPRWVNQWVNVQEDLMSGAILIQIKTIIPDISSLPQPLN